MRTLGTQARLRRLIRHSAEAAERLETEPLAGAFVATRLLELCRRTRDGWNEDSTSVPVAAMRAHVARGLSALEAAVARYELVANPARVHAEVVATALPLLLVLRGLEDFDPPELAEMARMSPRDLLKTA